MRTQLKQNRPIFCRTAYILPLILIFLFSALNSQAQNTPWQKTNSALIRIGDDQPLKIPLILIHGINGTDDCSKRGTVNAYWSRFRSIFNNDTELQARYSLYIFQYCSNSIDVSKIALELRDLIDENLPDRDHIILSHSMGGIVAKSYMAETVHLKGLWKNKISGDTVIGIITLATPHHGTPGANLPKTLENHFAIGWRTIYEKANDIYWRGSLGDSHPAVNDSNLPNRSDLRWDNYDSKLDVFKGDINEKLFNRNILFQRYVSKLIAYSGYLETSTSNTATKVLEDISKYKGIFSEVSAEEKFHRRLSIAGAVLFYGLSKDFGNTDGLVPFESGLFCDSGIILTSPNIPLPVKPKNYICKTPSRIRRFEPGLGGEISNAELPDKKTLSIFRLGTGFDHLDMLENKNVLKYAADDLKGFARSILPKIPPKVIAPEIPTLFLFDVSGSMAENGKIEQARIAGLLALGILKENRRLGRDNSPVSIWAFSGDCQPNTARQILPFTSNLTQAETAMRSQIPRPDGGTPLPQAVDKSFAQMLDYLNANPNIALGRIILLSDGQSTCGEIRPAGIYSQAKFIKFEKVNILTIGYDIQPGSQAERDLQYLASASGGRYFPANNGQQLSRAFEKTIRIYLPKTVSAPSSDFERGVQALLNRDFSAALRIWTIYVQANPNDALGYYNLALVCEAMEFYKLAAENYRKYLSLISTTEDAGEISARIQKAEADHRDKLFYYANLLRSDLAYLKAYYQRLFGVKNNELATEFAGFVDEKRGFYANLPYLLEIKSSWLKRSSDELTDSLNRLNNRVSLPSFDRDAVSLLTLPISQLEELIERLDEYNAQNFK